MNNQPKYIIFHSSDVSYKDNPNQLYAINRYHRMNNFPMSSLGWNVGYHVLVSGGKKYICRLDEEEGAHCNAKIDGLSMNFQSLGICWAGDGNVETIPFQDEVLIKQQIIEWVKTYDILFANIKNHRFYNPLKTCPGLLISDDYCIKLVSATLLTPKDEEQRLKKEGIIKMSGLLEQLKELLHRLLIILKR